MDARPHLLHDLLLPPGLFHWYQIILFGDRGTWVWTTCPQSLRSSARPGSEPATSWSQVRRPTIAPPRHLEDCVLTQIFIHSIVLCERAKMWASQTSRCQVEGYTENAVDRLSSILTFPVLDPFTVSVLLCLSDSQSAYNSVRIIRPHRIHGMQRCGLLLQM